jgi:hypothetical protein
VVACGRARLGRLGGYRRRRRGRGNVGVVALLVAALGILTTTGAHDENALTRRQ